MNNTIPKYLLRGRLLEQYTGRRLLNKSRRRVRGATALQNVVMRTRQRVFEKVLTENPGETKPSFLRRLLNFGRSAKG